MKNNRFAMLAATAVIAMSAILTGCGEKEPAPAEDTKATDTTKTEDTKKEDTTAASGDVQVINVNAKNWAWELDKTEVKAGQPVKLVVNGAEGFHGLKIEGADVADTQIPNGKETVIEFTPEKAGDLTLVCSIMCGTGHGQMKATLKVVE